MAIAVATIPILERTISNNATDFWLFYCGGGAQLAWPDSRQECGDGKIVLFIAQNWSSTTSGGNGTMRFTHITLAALGLRGDRRWDSRVAQISSDSVQHRLGEKKPDHQIPAGRCVPGRVSAKGEARHQAPYFIVQY
jgi:hypothetical protein